MVLLPVKLCSSVMFLELLYLCWHWQQDICGHICFEKQWPFTAFPLCVQVNLPTFMSDRLWNSPFRSNYHSVTADHCLALSSDKPYKALICLCRRQYEFTGQQFKWSVRVAWLRNAHICAVLNCSICSSNILLTVSFERTWWRLMTDWSWLWYAWLLGFTR